MAGKLVHFELPAEDVRSLVGELDVYPAQQGEKGPIVYFDTDDIDASIAKVRENGGQADDKMPIPHVGWFARCTDTEGNPFSLFQGDESAPAG